MTTLPNVIIAVLVRTAVAWHALAWRRRLWPGPLVIQGALTGDAARRAVEAGVAAVVVAQHGGRQRDGVAASLRAWPAVVTAVQGPRTVMDGGIRHGTDLVKALSLGARAVRPCLC